MKGYVNNIDFFNLEIQKYYAPPKTWDAEKIREITMNRIFSNEWLGSTKKDGAFYLFLKDEDGNCFLRGRSKSVKKIYLDKYEWVPHLHSFLKQLPNGTCLLGELYLPRKEMATSTSAIMNSLCDKAIARQKKEEDKLHYYIFDILSDAGESYLNMKAVDRFLCLGDYEKKYNSPYVEWAHYYRGKELWEHLQNVLAEGGEGVVITEQDSIYQPGKRPSRQCLKVKKELQDTIDCVIMGANPPTKIYSGKEIETWPYWFNEQTNTKILEGDFMKQVHHTIYQSYVEGAPVVPVTKNWFFGWAGSLKLGAMKNGQLVQVGNLSGITDEVKENWKDYIGKVCEISCMEIMTNQDGTQGLRHPKLIRIRDDKTKEECLWEDAFKS